MVLMWTAFEDEVIQPFLNIMVDYLLNPVKVDSTKGMEENIKEEVVSKCSNTDPFSELAFQKTTQTVSTLIFWNVSKVSVTHGMAS